MASNFRILKRFVASLNGKTRQMKLLVELATFMNEWAFMDSGNTIYLSSEVDSATFKISRTLDNESGVCGILQSPFIYGMLRVVKRDDCFELTYRGLIEQ